MIDQRQLLLVKRDAPLVVAAVDGQIAAVSQVQVLLATLHIADDVGYPIRLCRDPFHCGLVRLLPLLELPFSVTGYPDLRTHRIHLGE